VAVALDPVAGRARDQRRGADVAGDAPPGEVPDTASTRPGRPRSARSCPRARPPPGGGRARASGPPLLRAARPLVGPVDDGTVEAPGAQRGDVEAAALEGSVRLARAGAVSCSPSARASLWRLRALGGPDRLILGRHIVPQLLSPVVVALRLDVGARVLAPAGRSFQRFSPRPLTPDWGSLLAPDRAFGILSWRVGHRVSGEPGTPHGVWLRFAKTGSPAALPVRFSCAAWPRPTAVAQHRVAWRRSSPCAWPAEHSRTARGHAHPVSDTPLRHVDLDPCDPLQERTSPLGARHGSVGVPLGCRRRACRPSSRLWARSSARSFAVS
jgi:hypothetical protein